MRERHRVKRERAIQEEEVRGCGGDILKFSHGGKDQNTHKFFRFHVFIT